MAAPVFRLSDGPPPGHTGGFGEPTCTACHMAPGDTRHPSLALAGLPDSFTPGQSYEFEVVSRAENLSRAGFQLSARFDSSTTLAGRQGGSLSTSLDPMRVGFVLDSAKGVVYLRHTLEGTRVRPPGSARWRIRWTAPGQSQAVVFHAASVIASDDNSPLDDEVVTTSRLIRPASRPAR